MAFSPSVQDSGPVALLVVHGIGEQDPGDTLDAMLKGLLRAYGDRVSVERPTKDHAVLTGAARIVHVFEVYWAKLLSGEVVKGTFSVDQILETVWFPLLNYRSGRLTLDKRRHSAAFWSRVLPLLGSLIHAAWWGASFLASIPTGIIDAWRDLRSRGERPREPWSPLRAFRESREDPNTGRTILHDFMDERAGDVCNYVRGVAGAFPEDTEQSRQLIRNVGRIHVRFLHTARRVTRLGCNEIQVVAHSLGSVIAFLSMCPETRPQGPESAPVRLTRFYTIGSPLEKIRFFWTRLVDAAPNGPMIVVDNELVAAPPIGDGPAKMEWRNFYSLLDVVSGRLGSFPGWPVPKNALARGLGGLITSHVAYNRNADFLDSLSRGLTAEPSSFRPRWLCRMGLWILSVMENIAAPAVLALLASLGVAFFLAIAWPISTGISWLFKSLHFEWGASVAQAYVYLSVLFTMTVGIMIGSYHEAKRLHARFWADTPERDNGARRPD